MQSFKSKLSKLNFSTKKGVDLPLSLIITLIVLLLILVIMVTFTTMFTSEIDRSSNIQAVKSWAMKESLLIKKSGGLSSVFTSQSVPPVSPLSEPIQINSYNQLIDSSSKDYASKLIADAMIDCWSAFGNGKLEFIPSGSVFCYPCTAIKISDTVKETTKQTGHTTLSDFNIYLASTRPLGGNSKTYWEMLGGGSSDISALEKPYEINLLEDQYIFFGARKGGLDWPTVFKASGIATGVGAVAGTIIAVTLTGSLAIPVLIGAGGAGLSTLGIGAKEKLTDPTIMYPMLLVGSPSVINAYCNIKSEEDLAAIQSTKAALEKTEKDQITLLNTINSKIIACHNKPISKTIKQGEVFYCDTVEINLPDKYWISFDSTKIPNKIYLIKDDTLNQVHPFDFDLKYFAKMTTTIEPGVKGILYGNLLVGESFNEMNRYKTTKKILNIYNCYSDAICLTSDKRESIIATETNPQNPDMLATPKLLDGPKY